MNIKNSRYFLSNWIPKEKRQYRDKCSDQTKKQDNSKREKNILKWIDIRTGQRTRISLSNEYSSVTQTKQTMKIQRQDSHSRQGKTREYPERMSWWQNNRTFRRVKSLTEDKEGCILR